MARHGEVTLTLDRPPDAVFEAIVDVHSLPTWNERIVAFDDGPDRLEPGDEWVVMMSVLGVIRLTLPSVGLYGVMASR